MARTQKIPWPNKGKYAKLSYDVQPFETTPLASNVRTEAGIEKRLRGGSRPGLGRAYYSQLSVGQKVNLLDQITWIKSDGYYRKTDDFEGEQMATDWTQAAWKSYSPRILPENDNDIVNEENCGVVWDALSPAIDVVYAYDIELFASTYQGSHDGTYEIYAVMNNTTPNVETDGILVTLTLASGGGYSGSIKSYRAGVLTVTTAFAGGDVGYDHGGVFRVNISGTTVTAYWQGITLGTKTHDPGEWPTGSGTRIGFGMSVATAGRLALVDWFRVQYKQDATTQYPRTALLAASNGTLSYEDNYGAFLSATGNPKLNTTDLLHGTEYLQKYYIADNDRAAVARSTGTINAAGDELDDANVSDWTAVGIVANDYVVVVSDGCTDTSRQTTYTISAIDSDKITLNNPIAGGADTGVTYRVERAPKVFDPSTGLVSIWTADSGKGQVPSGCRVICTHLDSVFLSGADSDPHNWYKCHAGDANDWNYGAADTDVLRAVAGNNCDAGKIGQRVTAMIPFSDDYLIFGGESSLYVMRGNPAENGRIDTLNEDIGIVDKGAWAMGPNGEVFFLSLDGMYYLAPGANVYPQAVSREYLPDELTNIDREMFTVTMAYDVKHRGVHINLTPNSFKAGLHYWYDIANGAFWPVEYANANHEPTATHSYQTDAREMNNVLIGSKNGYINMHNREFETDLGTEITSYIHLGPFKGGDDYNWGQVKEILGSLAKDSGAVDWSLYAADSHEEVLTATSLASDTWSNDGYNPKGTPNLVGGSFMIRLENNSTTRKWALERLAVRIERAGEQRTL